MDLKFLAQQAVTFHQQGNLVQAEALYQQILDAEPGLFGPNYYMGLIRMQEGRFEEAASYLESALRITPDELGALMNHGMALRAARRSAEALKSFDRALALKPDLAEAMFNRGVALSDLERYEDAVDAYGRTLTLQPEFVSAIVNRGAALSALGRHDDAIADYDKALKMQPSNTLAHFNRGLALRSLGRSAEAVESHARAIALEPTNPELHYNQGIALLDLKRAQEALAAFDAIVAAGVRDAELLTNRGLALQMLGRADDALVTLEDALALDSQIAGTWVNRGLALRDLGRLDEALASFDMVLTLAPGSASAWVSRAAILHAMKRDDEALESFDKALAATPGHADALAGRAHLLWTARQDFAGAVAGLEKALRQEPDYPYALGELLHVKMYGADWTGFDAARDRVIAGVRAGKRIAPPFMFQAVADSPADLQACSRIWARDKYPQLPSAPHDPAARKDAGKIRIGYLSGEFRDQATQILMAGIYEKHDREKFELVAIDNGAGDGSPMRARLEKAFDEWLDIGALSDTEAAAQIRAANIDILVNLNGYFGAARMGVFARRPAPVQVNYLGFPATLGAPYMDYILADAVVIPDAEKPFYDEQVVHLPGSYQANDDRRVIAEAGLTRAQAGLPEKGFVFCNFNQSYKLTPAVFASWMRILKQVDGSVLWLLETRPPFADNTRKAAQAAGIASDRIVIARDLPNAEHLARLKLADLFLDETPYNAHTTASDALWAGLPLLTCRGTSFPGRVAASLLTAAGLPELIAESPADYEKQAVALAGDAAAFKAVRDKVAMACTSALFDTARTCRAIETAYARMWRTWLAGKAPEGFAVPDA